MKARLCGVSLVLKMLDTRIDPSAERAASGGRLRPRVVGGMFGLERTGFDGGRAPFLDGRRLLLANARSGIRLVTDALGAGQVWLPAYLCAAMLAGVADAGRIRFYGVDGDLRVRERGWLREVRQGDIVLAIDYFGFPCDRELCAEARARGAWLLEDASQALLSDWVGAGANFVVYSPRKTLALPDGGVLAIRDCEEWPDVPLWPPPASWSLISAEAFVARGEFDMHGGARRFLAQFQQAEAEAPAGAFAMGGFSRLLLKDSFDYDRIRRKRRENFSVLARRLGPMAIFPELPQGVVPLGFPIRVRERDRLRAVLFREEIFPAVHWAVPEIVPRSFDAGYRLAEECLTLICDQRYSPDDMERVASLVLKQAA